MKKILQIFLIFLFSLTIISCGDVKEESTTTDDTTTTTDTTAQMGGSFQGVELSLSTVVTTLAGTTGDNGSADNSTGTSASFNYPRGITTDGTNLYVAEYGNHQIRKIE